MKSSFEESTEAGAEAEFPRFLTSVHAEAAPVLLTWAAHANSALHAGLTAASASVALLSSAYLAPEGTHRASTVLPVAVMPVRIVRQEEPDHDLESRLSYAASLQGHLSAMKEMPPPVAVALEQPDILRDQPPSQLSMSSGDSAEPAALLIVHNLPETVTFADGVPAGIGVWAIGGQDAKELPGALKDGPAAAVDASVELISGAGVKLGDQSVVLPAAADMVLDTVAPAVPSAQETIVAQEVKPPDKPIKRKRRVHVRKTTPDVAEAQKEEEKSKPRAKRRKRMAEDAYRNPKPSPRKAIGEDAAAPQEAPEDGDDKPPGPVAKFFTWLKGDSKSDQKPDEEAVRPQPGDGDGTLRGLGMSPLGN